MLRFAQFFIMAALLLALPAWSLAQATSMFPVSADVATVKSDLILWATAFLGVVLAIYGYFKIRRIAR